MSELPATLELAAGWLRDAGWRSAADYLEDVARILRDPRLQVSTWHDPPPCSWQEYQDAARRNANDGGTESTPEQIRADMETVAAFYEWAERVLV